MSLSLGNNYLPITTANAFVYNDFIDKPHTSESSIVESQQVKTLSIEEFWIALRRQVANKEEKPSYETLEKLIRTLKQRHNSENLNSEDLLFIKKLAEKYEVSCPTEDWQQLFWKSYSATLAKL